MIAPKLAERAGLIIVPFEPRHVLWIVNRGHDAGLTARYRYEVGRWYSKQLSRGWTIMDEGRPIGSAGMTLTRPKCGLVWAYMGEGVKGHAKWFVKLSKAVLETTAVELDVNRVEAVVDLDFAQSVHWLRILGFEVETPNGMRNFGPQGETYLLMSRIF